MKINSGESYPNSRALGGTSHPMILASVASRRLQMHLANTAAFAFRIHILGGKNGVEFNMACFKHTKTAGIFLGNGVFVYICDVYPLNRCDVYVDYGGCFMCHSFESSTTPHEVCVKYCKVGDSDEEVVGQPIG